ncbi:MAG: 50S ribosomal protein L31e [Nanoarchaeota archaeon]
MAEKIESKIEREYIIPLRKEWRKVANYRRTGRAVKEIKKFIARHMKVSDRDTDKVKLDMYLNNEIWFRGKTKPPAKIKVRAVREGEIVKVFLVDMPEKSRFQKIKQEKLLDRNRAKQPKSPPKLDSKEISKEETAEEKKSEKEKELSVADQRAAEAKQDAKAKKHTTKVKEPQIHRMALQK